MPSQTRDLAGVEVPDTPIVARAIELAERHCDPYLFNHSMRSWLFAVVLAKQRGAAHDPEVLAVSIVLHDIGLAAAFNGARRFEVEGADAARAFAHEQGMDQRQMQLVWDGVALNSTPSICLYKEPEVALCATGIGVDWGGVGLRIHPWGNGQGDTGAVSQVADETALYRRCVRFGQDATADHVRQLCAGLRRAIRRELSTAVHG